MLFSQQYLCNMMFMSNNESIMNRFWEGFIQTDLTVN